MAASAFDTSIGRRHVPIADEHLHSKTFDGGSQADDKTRRTENETLKATQSNAVGIRKVISSGSKELVPKKYASIGQSCSSKSWRREVQDHAGPPTRGFCKTSKFTTKKSTFERIYQKISKPLIRTCPSSSEGSWMENQNCCLSTQKSERAQENASNAQSCGACSFSVTRRSPPVPSCVLWK